MNILGLDDLTEDFLRLSRAGQNKAARQAALAGVRVARDKVRASAPVRTGKLKRGAVAAVARQSEAPGVITAGVKIAAPRSDPEAPYYWKFIELGTRHMAPAPFIRPAWDSSLGEIEGATVSKLVEAIDKALTSHG